MELKKIIFWRTWAARLAALFCGVAVLGLLDGLVAQLRTPANLIQTLPGASVPLDGPAPEVVQVPGDLTSKDDTRRPEAFQLKVTDIHRGYFLGTHRWRGTLTVSPDLPPGHYALAVFAARNPSQGGMVFRVVVHPDEGSLRRSSPSLLQSLLDLSPWKFTLAWVPLILAAFALVFLLSQRLEGLLAQQGMAEIYRVVRKEGFLEVAFGLGTDHGVAPGQRLKVLGPDQSLVGEVEVRESSATDSWGVISAHQEVATGFLVSRL